MKKPEDMTRAELVRATEMALARVSANCTAFIEAGRGQERPSEIRMKSDPLALEYAAVNNAYSALVEEARRRENHHGSLHRIIVNGRE